MLNNRTTPTAPLHSPDLEAEPLFVSVGQAAHLLGVGTTFTWELVRSGALPSVRLGRRVLIPRVAIQRLAQSEEE